MFTTRARTEEWKARFNEAKRTARALFRSPLSTVGLSIALIFFLISIIAPYITPYPEDVTGSVHTRERLKPPSSKHFFGTDDVGRDVFSRVLYGTRISLEIALVIIGVAVVVGVPLGLLAGFYGGVVEEIIMRLTDIFLAVPGIVLAVTIVSALGPGIDEELGRGRRRDLGQDCQAHGGGQVERNPLEPDRDVCQAGVDLQALDLATLGIDRVDLPALSAVGPDRLVAEFATVG